MSTAAATAPSPADTHRDEINAFVVGEYPKVVAGVALITGDRPAAEDAVQDAMVAAWQRRGEIDNLPAWITVVASNRARNRLRKWSNERKALKRVERGLEEAGSETVAERLTMAAAVEMLSERQRQAVVMHYYLDLSVAACAAALGVHEGTVKTTLHRARETLGRLLDEPSEGRDDRPDADAADGGTQEHDHGS